MNQKRNDILHTQTLKGKQTNFIKYSLYQVGNNVINARQLMDIYSLSKWYQLLYLVN